MKKMPFDGKKQREIQETTPHPPKSETEQLYISNSSLQSILIFALVFNAYNEGRFKDFNNLTQTQNGSSKSGTRTHVFWLQFPFQPPQRLESPE